MKLEKVLEQQIAVFGESGSGKTVMLSSFYGATQESGFWEKSLVDVTATDTGQGHRLLANYVGMRDDGNRPATNRFSSTSYGFAVTLRDGNIPAKGSKQFDALRLVWHDYPGEWFEQSVSGPEEAQRRVDTFRQLVGSDVALLLVDGQRLLDHAGEEERYLKSLFSGFRNAFKNLKGALLEDGKPLVQFPRIWMLALSKSDLIPDLDVFQFRDLVVSKAHEDIDELRHVLEGLVESPDALSVGEDFVLLSSANFSGNQINVDERVGLDLILPLASMLPFERHVKWVEEKNVGANVAQELLVAVGPMALMLLGRAKFVQAIPGLADLLKNKKVSAAMFAGARLAGDQLKRKKEEALEKNDYMAATLAEFRIALQQGEQDRVLIRSKK